MFLISFGGVRKLWVRSLRAALPSLPQDSTQLPRALTQRAYHSPLLVKDELLRLSSTLVLCMLSWDVVASWTCKGSGWKSPRPATVR